MKKWSVKQFDNSLISKLSLNCGISELAAATLAAKGYSSAESVMEKLEITELSKKCYHELSGGQQQRVLLARALCGAKKLLILDEPTSALDSVATHDFYRIVSELSSEGITVIMISHDIENAVKYASSVLHLGESEPLFFGSKEEYIKSFVKQKGGEE